MSFTVTIGGNESNDATRELYVGCYEDAIDACRKIMVRVFDDMVAEIKEDLKNDLQEEFEKTAEYQFCQNLNAQGAGEYSDICEIADALKEYGKLQDKFEEVSCAVSEAQSALDNIQDDIRGW